MFEEDIVDERLIKSSGSIRSEPLPFLLQLIGQNGLEWLEQYSLAEQGKQKNPMDIIYIDHASLQYLP
ncbi:hypothetical protein BLX87_12170 [Bacillus sp. VT-16-64]|nr:hypothetical protein BLX87_12170 [Bacillus sp. VT-16-64]